MNLNYGSLLSNPTIIIGILIGLGVIALIYYRQWAKSKGRGHDAGEITGGEETPDDKDIKPEWEGVKSGVLVCIRDNITAQCYDFVFISEKTAKAIISEFLTLGRQWDREGKKVYGLNRFKDDIDGKIKLRPIPTPSLINSAPAELHYDIRQPEVGMVISELMKEDTSTFIEKYWKILLWVFAMAFLAFMWSQS